MKLKVTVYYNKRSFSTGTFYEDSQVLTFDFEEASDDSTITPQQGMERFFLQWSMNGIHCFSSCEIIPFHQITGIETQQIT